MFSNQKIRQILAAGLAVFAAQCCVAADNSVDSASFEFATGRKIQMVRFGVQSDWGTRWFQSNGTHLSGYWDTSLAKWRGNQYRDIPDTHQYLTDIGFTPVFRFERDDKKGAYAEGAIGVHRLSQLYDNDGRRLSTRFEFGDHLGAGYIFDNKWEVGMKLQHFSNGGYKKPNSGVNFIVAKVSTHF